MAMKSKSSSLDNDQEVKRRTKAVSELFNSYTTYDGKLGETQDVLVTEISHDKKHYVGHNKCYDQVLIPMEKRYLGKMVRVKIYETGKHFLKGDPFPGQFEEMVKEDAVDLDPEWPSAGKISTRDGDFGEEDGCCGECGDGGCGGGGDGDCGGGDCGEGDDCCKKSPKSASIKTVFETENSVNSEEKPKLIGEIFNAKAARISHFPLWFKMGVLAILVAILFRVTEVMI